MAAAYRTAVFLVKGLREFTRAGYEQAEHRFDNTSVPCVIVSALPLADHSLRADRTSYLLPACSCAGSHMARAACSALNKGLEGKVCLVTGANQGLGLQTAQVMQPQSAYTAGDRLRV